MGHVQASIEAYVFFQGRAADGDLLMGLLSEVLDQ